MRCFHFQNARTVSTDGIPTRSCAECARWRGVTTTRCVTRRQVTATGVLPAREAMRVTWVSILVIVCHEISNYCLIFFLVVWFCFVCLFVFCGVLFRLVFVWFVLFRFVLVGFALIGLVCCGLGCSGLGWMVWVGFLWCVV